jgi:hypothetical protein
LVAACEVPLPPQASGRRRVTPEGRLTGFGSLAIYLGRTDENKRLTRASTAA